MWAQWRPDRALLAAAAALLGQRRHAGSEKYTLSAVCAWGGAMFGAGLPIGKGALEIVFVRG